MARRCEASSRHHSKPETARASAIRGERSPRERWIPSPCWSPHQHPGQRNGRYRRGLSLDCWHRMPPGPLGHRSSGGLAVRMRGAGCFNMIWFMSVSVHGFVDTVRVNLRDCTRTEGTLGGNDHLLGIFDGHNDAGGCREFPLLCFCRQVARIPFVVLSKQVALHCISGQGSTSWNSICSRTQRARSSLQSESERLRA